MFIDPGQGQHDGVSSLRLCPDRRNVTALAEQSRQFVMKMRIFDRVAVAIAQGAQLDSGLAELRLMVGVAIKRGLPSTRRNGSARSRCAPHRFFL